MKKKQVITGVCLVLGLGVSIYLWSTVGLGQDKGDPKVEGQQLTFTCAKCKNTFKMTVAEAAAMRRAHDGQIICPACKAVGAQKHDVTIPFGGDGGFKPTDGQDSGGQTQEAAPPEKKPTFSGGGMKKKEP